MVPLCKKRNLWIDSETRVDEEVFDMMWKRGQYAKAIGSHVVQRDPTFYKGKQLVSTLYPPHRGRPRSIEKTNASSSSAGNPPASVGEERGTRAGIVPSVRPESRPVMIIQILTIILFQMMREITKIPTTQQNKTRKLSEKTDLY